MNYIVEKFNKTKSQVIIGGLNRIISCCGIMVVFILLVLFSVGNNEQLSKNLHLFNDENIKTIRIFLITFCSLLLVFNILYILSMGLGSYNDYLSYKLQYIILSIFSLNIIALVLNIIEYSILTYYLQNKDKTIIKSKNNYIRLKRYFGIRRGFTFDYVLIAMFCGLTILLAYVETNGLPNLPYGGSVALKYIPLIILAFLHSTLASWFCGAISALMSLLFIQSGFIISPGSYLLDYFLPMTTPCVAGLMRFPVNKDRKYITYVNYVVMTLSIFLLIYLGQVLSGYFIWTTLFPDSAGPGYTNGFYSVVYNFISVFLLTYPISQIIIPIILRSLAPVYGSYFERN